MTDKEFIEDLQWKIAYQLVLDPRTSLKGYEEEIYGL